MQLPTVRMGSLEVSRLIVGGNPFSGFSHQSEARSAAMRAWYTPERIVETLFQAQDLGLNACLCRGDEHIAGVLRAYWDQGGTMRWIAQTASRWGAGAEGVRFCVEHGASACFLHGGVVDHLIAKERFDELSGFADQVRASGLPVGIAGHMPEDFCWAESNLDLDFYMVCYYDPSPRQENPHNDPTAAERFAVEDRDARVATIQTLSRPVIHYKVLAAGRTPPEEAFAFAAHQMRPNDAICVGVYTEDNPNMLAEDAELLLRHLCP